MGTALQLHPHQSLRLVSSSFSCVTSNINNHRTCCYLQLPHQNVLQQQPMKYLTLKSNPLRFRFRFRFSQPKLFCAINISNNNNNPTLLEDTMADNSRSVNGNSTILNDKKEEVEKKLEKSTLRYIPPPPEKPLPDDCCGSGCVRCVWDIYYEELEAYNKLYKTVTTPDSSDASGASVKQS